MRCEISIERTGSFFFPQFAVFLCRSGLFLSLSLILSSFHFFAIHREIKEGNSKCHQSSVCLRLHGASVCLCVCAQSEDSTLLSLSATRENRERADHENVASVTNPFCLQWLAGWLAASKVLHYISHSTTTTDSKLANCLHLPNPFFPSSPSSSLFHSGSCSSTTSQHCYSLFLHFLLSLLNLFFFLSISSHSTISLPSATSTS